jgi:hypothetical protein
MKHKGAEGSCRRPIRARRSHIPDQITRDALFSV